MLKQSNKINYLFFKCILYKNGFYVSKENYFVAVLI